jgi:iron complex transport system permease protein
MSKKKTIRCIVAFWILIIGIFIFFLLNVAIGSVRIDISQIVKSLFSNSTDPTVSTIIWNIRLPRSVAVIILGGALALSGYLLQTFFRNPIAGPFVLGISSGAKMCVALTMVFLMSNSLKSNSLTLVVSAFVGSLISLGFVLLLTKRIKSMSMLVVCGVMIGYICSAITELVVTFASDADIVNLHNWSRGSFSGITWSNVEIMTVMVFVSFIVVLFLSKPLDAYIIGDSHASSMGVNIKALRVGIVILSSILSACIVAFAGPISFVGIAVPHLIRKLFNTNRPIIMIPASFLGGSVFCLFCDLLARNILSPTELNISTVTAVFGAPVVIIILLDKKKKTMD